jgi:thiamine-phosphate pyrophosphorylase
MKNIDLTLYFVTDSANLPEPDFLQIVREACEGGVTLVQLREKDRSGIDYLRLAQKVKEITDEYSIPLIIDDRVDVAISIDAAGVHLGQKDLPVRFARHKMGENKIIGATVKTVEQGLRAMSEGADYFGTGAIYPTTTKVVTHITEVSTLNEIAAACPGIPIAAIGGLNAANMHVLYDSEAVGIAVVSAIMKAEKPLEAARELKQQVMTNFRRLK